MYTVGNCRSAKAIELIETDALIVSSDSHAPAVAAPLERPRADDLNDCVMPKIVPAGCNRLRNIRKPEPAALCKLKSRRQTETMPLKPF